MSAMTFDTLKTAPELKQAGFPDAQVEALSRAMGAALTNGVATKEDFAKLCGKIDAVVARLDGRIDSVRAELKGDIQLLKWMVGASIGLTAAVLWRLLFVGR